MVPGNHLPEREKTIMADEVPADLTTAIEKLNRGVSYKDLVAILAPRPGALPLPKELPLPAQITDQQKVALERLPEVYGSVVPAERRDLQPFEVTLLLDERAVLATIASMAKTRTEDIRTTVLNAHDVRIEGEHGEGVPDDIDRDKDGHYIRKGEVRGDAGAGTKFAAEARAGSPTMDPDILKGLDEDPEVEWFKHEDYLGMTRLVRVFDEEKTMILLRTRPELLRALREATVPGRGSVAVQPRKA